MTGFSLFSDLTTALQTSSNFQRISFIKTPSSNTALIPHSTWLNAGNPAAGTTPTVGLGGAVAVSKTSTGALQFNNPVSGKNNFLMRLGLYRNNSSASLGGTYYLVDRLAHANVSIDQVDGAFSPVIDGTARLAAGEGAQIICEVTTALGAAVTNVFALTYTDQDGNSSVTQQVTTIASQAVDKFAYSATNGPTRLFVPLASGDRGARTITDWDLVSGIQTGAMTIALVRVLAILPEPLASSYVENEYAISMQNFVKIPNDACLQIFFVPALANTSELQAEIFLVQG